MRNIVFPSFCFLLLSIAACDCGGEPPTRSCITDAECPAAQECVDNVCTTSGEPDCTVAEDCGDGFACVDGACMETGAMCDDPDRDGYGPGCSAGEDDCDQTDATQTGREVCDGQDNDCDGVADNGVLSECGDCRPGCMEDGVGSGGDPFDPDTMEADGVGVDDDGALVLDSRRINTSFIWVANTSEGSVSKINTEAPFQEVGRYRTGPLAGGANDPSRTSVNSLGDAYVANRRGSSLTRVSTLGDECPDQNGDGTVQTSRDLNGNGVIDRDPALGEFLAWGEDECVLWHHPLAADMPGEGLIRAVAAQDVEGPDGELIEYVWVGGFSTRKIAKIDGVTGETIFVTDAPAPTYGFALDGNGQLWVAGRGTHLGRLDTNRCVDAASCAEAVCTEASLDGTACDGAVKAAIPSPFRPYGITVDFNQRVWLGGDVAHPTMTYSPRFARYNPAAPGGERWVSVNVSPNGHVVNGIAADADGNVWGAAWSTAGIIRIDADNPTSWVTVPGTVGVRNKGIAIDSAGKVWSITNGDNQAVVVTPGPTLMENTVQTGVAVGSLVGNYTYSDMTGLQLRLATNPRGYYRHLFEGCDAEGINTNWGALDFGADTPAGTDVQFRVKTAATVEGLDDADWIVIGNAPPDTSPLSIGDRLREAGVDGARYLLLEIGLRAERSSTSEVITPRVRSVSVEHTCPEFLG